MMLRSFRLSDAVPWVGDKCALSVVVAPGDVARALGALAESFGKKVRAAVEGFSREDYVLFGTGDWLSPPDGDGCWKVRALLTAKPAVPPECAVVEVRVAGFTTLAADAVRRLIDDDVPFVAELSGDMHVRGVEVAFAHGAFGGPTAHPRAFGGFLLSTDRNGSAYAKDEALLTAHRENVDRALRQLYREA